MAPNAERSRRLVVLLHAYNSSPDALGAVRRAVERSYGPDVETLVPPLDIGLFSTRDPNLIAHGMIAKIDAAWDAASARGAPFDAVILVGHSFGALLARKIYVIACGEHPRALLEPEIGARAPTPWASQVERIVLLAGMNRGWRVTHHLGILRAAVGTVLVAGARLVCRLTGRRFAIFHIEQGSIFLTQLRLQWLWMRRRARADGTQPGGALTIQLLGTVDDMVSPQDNVDLVSGGDFRYLDVPVSGHADVIEMEDKAPGLDGRSKGALRSAAFDLALRGTPEALDEEGVVPDDLTSLLRPTRGIKEVVFVIHGIRDRGYWTQRIARQVRREATRRGRRFETETSSYGYFPMLPFLLSFKRRQKVQWLMDQYAEAVALYPDAEKFHFVGHSNGTYCLATALEDYPCCRFENVVFAGSVVRKGFDWARFRNRDHPDAGRRYGTVGEVLNFVATGDIVVAVFPNLFQYLWRSQRLGSAGHSGFAGESEVQQVRYIAGGHSAALAEQNWTAIADFVLDGTLPGIAPELARDRQGWFTTLLGRWPITVAVWLLLIATFLVGVPLLILWGLGEAQQWLKALAMIAYGLLLIKVLTRL